VRRAAPLVIFVATSGIATLAVPTTHARGPEGQVVAAPVSPGGSGEPSQERSGELSQERSGEASQERSGELSQEASGEPSQERSGEPSQERSGELSQEASGEPSQERSGEASQEASGELSQERSGEPSQTPRAAGKPAPASETPPPVSSTAEPPAEVAPSEAKLRDAVPGSSSEVARFHHRFGEGLSLATKDGRFSLQLRARMQLRYELQHPNVEGEQTTQRMQVRRMRLLLRGNVFAKHVKYYIQFGFSAQDMASGLPSEPPIRRNPVRDARIELDRFRDATAWFGQFKVPFNRQRVISSAKQNLVDRSHVNAEFTLDRDLGFQLLSKDIGGLGGKLGYNVGVFLGEGRNAYDLSDLGLLYVGRLEVRPFGEFDDYSDGDLGRSKRPNLSIGVAYAYQDRAHAERGVIGEPPADGGTTNYHHFTADTMVKWVGLSLNSAFFWRHSTARRNGGELDDTGAPIPTVAARQGIGWYGQLGWVVPRIPLELVARYGLIRDIYGDESSLPDSDEVGGGVNWYFVGHDLKLQIDYLRGWDESLGTSFADQARHGTDSIRIQGQLFF